MRGVMAAAPAPRASCAPRATNASTQLHGSQIDGLRPGMALENAGVDRTGEQYIMNDSSSPMSAGNVATQEPPDFVPEFHGVRYQVKDIARSVAFYTRHLGFKVGHQQPPAFATVSL